ncbi:hypothetical protein CEUSTIGMA_g13410.t1 [Chlamydomonas eustigma]|uniref:Uncharacterized protein n=1 Tax=Chlamydomonas eustigma TaxID=1157962 RepID=A0A250XSF3_9CHLO|nr:hypothetical protein CEUSTIGMA_g13410.t1 [Chlamydomonas eustigma]|eukprot:GAX85994.1 hypothetical protein CEUSTIGMA_g13410.t1 [Chlamydomonas eustigma]
MTLMRGGKNATSLPVMQSKRGMAKSELCIADDWNKAEEDYWPDDPSMHSAIDSAFQDMEQLLSRDLSSEGSAGEYNMWTHKWKAPANKRAKTGPASSGPSSRSTVCLGMKFENIASQLRPFIDRIKVSRIVSALLNGRSTSTTSHFKVDLMIANMYTASRDAA